MDKYSTRNNISSDEVLTAAAADRKPQWQLEQLETLNQGAGVDYWWN